MNRNIIISVTVLLIILNCITIVAAQQKINDFVPVTDAMLQKPGPDDWLMWRRTQNSWGYSPLQQITRDNVGQLQQVWSRDLVTGMQEGTPLVHGNVMYMPNPNITSASSLMAMLWSRPWTRAPVSCCGNTGGKCRTTWWNMSAVPPLPTAPWPFTIT